MTIQEAVSAVSLSKSFVKKAVSAPDVLNEAYSYDKPSAFSRAMRMDFGNVAVVLISGTGSVGTNGETLYAGDFREQCRRTFLNVTRLLEAEGATWKDVVRTTFYIRDMDRDYAAFNEERNVFYAEQGLDPLPASTAIEVRLCRPDLLLELEGIAVFRTE